MTQQSSQLPPRPARRRRWLLLSFVTLILLLVVAIIATQIVLSTDIPRRIVLAQVQRILGLRMTAGSVQTGWFGHTTLTDVKFSLPLQDATVLESPKILAGHTSLIPILLGSFDLDELEIEKPTLHIQQDSAGDWNAVQVLRTVIRSAGPSDPQAPRSNRPIHLPTITIRDGTAIVTDNQNRTSTIQPVIINAKHAGPLVYQYDGKLATNLEVTGQVTPATGWEHEVTFTATRLDDLLRPLLPTVPKQLNSKGVWTGRIANAGITGNLQLASLSTEQGSISGSAKAAADDQSIQIEPDKLLLHLAEGNVPDVKIVAGKIRADRNAIVADNLQIAAYDGLAMGGGKWNRIDNSVELRAAWRDAAVSRQLTSTGSIIASLQTPWPGQPQINATIETSAQIEAGSVETSLKISGQGDSFSAIDWNATISRLNLTGRRSFELRDVSAKLHTRGKQIALDELQIADRPQLRGRGQLDLADQSWWAWAEGTDLPLLMEDSQQVRFSFDINTWGKQSLITLKDLYLRLGDLRVAGEGFYDAQLPRPVNLELTVDHLPLAGQEELSPILNGQLAGNLSLIGTVNPPNLAMSGELTGRELLLHRRALGDLRVQLDGQLTEEGAELRTTEMSALGGTWSLIGKLPANRRLPAKMQVDVRSLPLQELGEFTNTKDLYGSVDAHVFLEIPSLRRSRITARGNFVAREVGASQVRIDRAGGELELRNNLLHVAPISLAYRDGKGQAGIEVPLDRPEQLNVDLTLDRWPAERGNASAEISGRTRLAIQLADRTATGPIDLSADLHDQSRRIGSIQLSANIDGKTIVARQIRAETLGGLVQGTASADWSDPLKTRAELNWSNIDAATIASLAPTLNGLTGKLSGSLNLRPVSHRHALGPLQLDIEQTPEGAKFNGLVIGDASMIVYLDVDRIVTEDARFNIAGGTAKVFARATKRDNQAVSSLVTIDFDSLDLNQMVNAVDPKHNEPMPGRAAGSVTLAGDPYHPRNLFGSGEMRLTQSDLIHFDPLAFLYGRMNAAGAANPNGTANFRARFEKGNLIVTDATIYERGLEVFGLAVVQDVWSMPDSPLTGTVAGTARPLREIKLPFMANVDQILSQLQANLTPVRLGGTVREPKAEAGVFADINDNLRSILIGNVKTQSNKSTGQ